MAFYFYAMLAAIGIPFLVLGLAFEFWKKLWLASEGQVIAAKIPKYSTRRSVNLKVLIQYRYSYRGVSHSAAETKTFEIEYHMENQVLRELDSRFPVGGKIVVFHPRSMPGLSSITPGGANIPKLFFSLLVSVGLLILVYYFRKLQ
jgi:hypothetical protein